MYAWASLCVCVCECTLCIRCTYLSLLCKISWPATGKMFITKMSTGLCMSVCVYVCVSVCVSIIQTIGELSAVGSLAKHSKWSRSYCTSVRTVQLCLPRLFRLSTLRPNSFGITFAYSGCFWPRNTYRLSTYKETCSSSTSSPSTSSFFGCFRCNFYLAGFWFVPYICTYNKPHLIIYKSCKFPY